MKPEEFADHHVVVTGGSSGIGKAIACRFAQMGSHVHILARDETKLSAAAEEIQSHRRGDDQRVTYHSCDVSNLEQVEATFDAFRRDGVRTNVLINNAGIAHPGYFEKLSTEIFERTMRVNYFGVLFPTKVAVPDMLEQGSGYVVNVSSMAGLIGIFGYTAYSASKFAVRGFSESLRHELKPRGITVSMLCPPDTDTPQLEEENRFKPVETAAVSGSIRAMQPEQVAESLIRGMRRRRFVIIPGFESWMTYRLRGIVPGLVDFVIDRQLAAALAKRQGS